MPQIDIFNLYKSIFAHNKRKALSYELSASKQLKEYRNNHIRHGKRSFSKSSLTELLQSIKSSRISFLGDFHTFSENSKNLERLLRTIEKDQYFSLGVEFIHAEHQEQVDKYLRGEITEADFLKAVDYQKSWIFPWHHYQKFFEIAKSSKLRIIALNSEGDLLNRDKHAAEILAKHLNENPKTKIMVLFGEYHIAPNKLPQMVQKHFSSPIKQTIIHQNLDDVFWKLHENKIKEQVIKFADTEFSLQTSPPWVKYESMIYWYENLSVFSELTISEQLEKYVRFNSSGDESEHFIFLCRKILDAIDFSMEESDLIDFNLYGYTKLDFIIRKIQKIKHTPTKNFITSLVKRGKTFRLPYTSDYYCSDYSINRLSFLAGSHIYNILLQYRNINFDKELEQGTQSKRFLLLLYRSLISYFASKIINPYLKCDRYQDLIKISRSPAQPQSKRKAISLAIDVLDRKKKLADLLKGQNLRTMQSCAKAVGNLMAECLFENFFQRSPRSFQSLKIIIMNTQHLEEEFTNLLDILLPYKEFKNQKKRLL